MLRARRALGGSTGVFLLPTPPRDTPTLAPTTAARPESTDGVATTSTTGEAVGLRAVSKRFGATQAIEQVTLSVARREILALVGPSGCGKSTVLSIVAGLLDPDAGEVLLDGQPAPNRLGQVSLMPQRDALLPWRTVVDNVVLGPEIAGADLRQARERARELLPRFGLEGFGDHYPAALSGGMRQRAAFLRTVLIGRGTMLLDEPFGALDALTRRSMQEWLLDLWGDIGGTILLVTHDVEEALLLSDRVAVMTARPGRIKLVERVHLPRPREPRMIGLPEVVAQKARLLDALHDEVALALGTRR